MWTAGHPNEVAQHYGLEYCKIESVGDIDQPFDVALIAGAGLLPTDFVVNNTILNCHGGLIPSVRGLDAFKWAIYDSQPLGNTLHIIDADVDAGKPLKALRTPVQMIVWRCWHSVTTSWSCNFFVPFHIF